jgi:hypothetical protein
MAVRSDMHQCMQQIGAASSGVVVGSTWHTRAADTGSTVEEIVGDIAVVL